MKGLFIPEITAEMFRNGCLESIEALMADGEIYDIDYSPWIPVSERLPEEIKTKGHGLCNVLVTHKHAGIFRTSFAVFDKDKFYTNNNFKHEDKSVIAWMPLPEPYKAESEDKV